MTLGERVLKNSQCAWNVRHLIYSPVCALSISNPDQVSWQGCGWSEMCFVHVSPRRSQRLLGSLKANPKKQNKTENRVDVSLCCDLGAPLLWGWLGDAGQEQPLKVLPRRGGGRLGTMWGCSPHVLELLHPRNIPAAHKEQPDPLSWLVSREGEGRAQGQTETRGPACARTEQLSGCLRQMHAISQACGTALWLVVL